MTAMLRGDPSAHKSFALQVAASRSPAAENYPEVPFDSRGYIIPPEIARPLLFSSQLILIQAIAAAVVAYLGAPKSTWALAAVAAVLWFCSTNLWRSPQHGLRAWADRAMVVVMISVASVIVFIDAPTFVPEWAGGWAVVGIVFTANELKFWTKKDKTRRDYVLCVWVHLVAVHIFGNVICAGALVALYDASRTRPEVSQTP